MLHSATHRQPTAGQTTHSATDLAVLPRIAARAVTPRPYRAAHGLKRRVERRFYYSGEALPRAREACDLVVAMGLPHDEEARAAMLRQAESSMSPVTLVGVGRAGRGERTKTALSPDRFVWRLAGRPLDFEPASDWEVFLTSALERVYRDTPLLPRCSAGEKMRAARALLHLADPIVDRGGPVESALVNAGLLRVAEDRGSYRLLDLVSELSTAQPDGRLMSSLLEYLYGDYTGPAPVHRLDRLLHWLASPPRGLRGPTARLYLALALRYHGQDMDVDGRPLGPDLFEGAPVVFRYNYADRDQLTFLRSLGRVLGHELASQQPGLDLWERVRRQVDAWFAAVPAWTRACRDRLSHDGARLLDLLETSSGGCSRTLLGQRLPAAFGGDGIPPVEAQSSLLDRLESARQEVDAFLESEQDRLAEALARVFGPDRRGAALECLEAASRHWWERLHPDTAAREFSQGGQALRATILSDGSVGARWFGLFPTAMGLPPLAQWQQDHVELLTLRARLARLELEQWPWRQAFPLPDDFSACRQAAGRWIGDVLRAADLSAPQSEALLFDLLDELVWE